MQIDAIDVVHEPTRSGAHYTASAIILPELLFVMCCSVQVEQVGYNRIGCKGCLIASRMERQSCMQTQRLRER